jgi:hypothetical protein
VLTEASRWVIPANGSVHLVVQFASEAVGKANDVLCFDVVCGERNNKVALTAACDYPRINTEARCVCEAGVPGAWASCPDAQPGLTQLHTVGCRRLPLRSLYLKTARVQPPTPNVRQQFILPTSTFEFGPLLAGRDRAGFLEGAHPEHTAKFRLTNSGLFAAHADFWLKSEGPAADPAAAASSDAKKKSGGVPEPARRVQVIAAACNVVCMRLCGGLMWPDAAPQVLHRAPQPPDPRAVLQRRPVPSSCTPAAWTWALARPRS